MLEKPNISEELIGAGIQDAYRLPVSVVIFLPLGYDVNTAVYRLVTSDGELYFLKLRRTGFKHISVALPYFLSSSGIPAIIPPLMTRSGELDSRIEDYTIILYPYIPGKDGYEARLSEAQWVSLGNTLKHIHTTQLPDELAAQIARENYDPQWRMSVKQFLEMVFVESFTDPVADRLAAFLRSKRVEIDHILRRAEELAHILQEYPPEYVLCHGDAHPGNYLITEQGRIYLVDWDDPIFAPKEHDLMCFGGGMSGDMPGGEEERQFYQGYGDAQLNPIALVYYRYERIIQDISEFCKQLLLTDGGGADREQAYKFLTSSFEPGSVMEAAIITDNPLIKARRKA